ncbi:hypothetical protein NADFUDRAFT_81058 [Nadsonia fulvescens var. elongata DSM 6958]|uniref:RING-type domain-containing protein n=1 Tax=Nadsonia fulvescens var. elongata DSM 6958 TaxID=857566 RepID=A0A1E3PRS9_9ASCO|nr:hypothetical protein NADFUDRAFT_81058 [Nadsonia fulvescens var. elongata DSM 6958]
MTPSVNAPVGNQTIYNTQSNPQLDISFTTSGVSGQNNMPVFNHVSPDDINSTHSSGMNHNDSNSDNGIVRSCSFRSLKRPSLLGLNNVSAHNNASVSTPDQYNNMLSNMAALVDDSFSNSSIPQAIHSYTLPDFSSSAFKFCAEQYLIRVPTDFNLFQACEYNADVAALVGLNRNSQVWRVIATSIKWEHEGFIRDCCLVLPRKTPVFEKASNTSTLSPSINSSLGSNTKGSKLDNPVVALSTNTERSDSNSASNPASSQTGSRSSNIAKSFQKLSMKEDSLNKETKMKTLGINQPINRGAGDGGIPIKLTDEKGGEGEIILQSFDSASILPSSLNSTSSTENSYEIQPTLSRETIKSQTLDGFDYKTNYTSLSSNDESNGNFHTILNNGKSLHSQGKEITASSSSNARLDDIKEENYDCSSTTSGPIRISSSFSKHNDIKNKGETDIVFGSVDSYNIGSSYGSKSSIDSNNHMRTEPKFEVTAESDVKIGTGVDEIEGATKNINSAEIKNIGTSYNNSRQGDITCNNEPSLVGDSQVQIDGRGIKTGLNSASLSASLHSSGPSTHTYTSVRVNASDSLISNEFSSTDTEAIGFAPTIYNNNVLKASYTQYAQSLNQPWRPINLIKQAVDWSCLQGDAQMCSVLSLLFGEIYPESFYDGESDVVNNIVGNMTASDHKKDDWSGAIVDDSDDDSESDTDINVTNHNDREYYNDSDGPISDFKGGTKKRNPKRKTTSGNNSGTKGLSTDDSNFYRTEWALFKQQEWTMHYIEILQRRLLFLSSATIIKHVSSRFPETIGSLGQIDTNLNTVCHRCFKPLSENIEKTKSNHKDESSSNLGSGAQVNKNIDLSNRPDKDVGFWYCLSCKKMLDGCILCNEPIKGYAIVNFGCGHRGHASCMSDWVIGQKMSECPSGCGHVLFR